MARQKERRLVPEAEAVVAEDDMGAGLMLLMDPHTAIVAVGMKIETLTAVLVAAVIENQCVREMVDIGIETVTGTETVIVIVTEITIGIEIGTGIGTGIEIAIVIAMVGMVEMSTHEREVTMVTCMRTHVAGGGTDTEKDGYIHQGITRDSIAIKKNHW